MKPGDLTAASFAGYGESAQALAMAHLRLLRAMPLSLLPGYLLQIREYPTLFPVEQERLRRQLDALGARPGLMGAFAGIAVPAAMEGEDWVGRPSQFVATFSGALWQTGQIDAYHRAAEELFAALPAGERVPGSTPPMLIAVIGRGTSSSKTPGDYPLFTRLRKQGLYARKVEDAGAAEALCGALLKRAKADATAYAHWYVDGGASWEIGESPVQRFTFPQLAPVTDAVLREMDRAVREGSGPEVLADRLRAMSPAALGLVAVTRDERMARFYVSLLTQGSGTQLYSTSFVQAAAVELVRRAQPATLLVRFAPRRKPASMNDMLEQRGQSAEMDPQGALVDADMAVYYAWLAMQHQPAGEQARLLVYAEGHGEAFVAGPGVTRGVESTTPLGMAQVLALVG
jgi:hypothetical protein